MKKNRLLVALNHEQKLLKQVILFMISNGKGWHYLALEIL